MARALLDRTSIFSALSDTFKDEISKLMSPVEAPAGHVFTKEGEEITKFIIVETGYLVRTKASADGEGEPFVLDTIGEAGVTGFMHVAARDSGVAFATITAGEEGAKVWTVGVEFDQLLRYVANDDLRIEVLNINIFHLHFLTTCIRPTNDLRSNPDLALETIQYLTQALRRETKITRATTNGGKTKDESSTSLRKSYNRPDDVEVFKVLCYDTTSWVRENFEPQVEEFNQNNQYIVIKMDYTADRLDVNTASYAVGYDAVCLFVNDTASADVLQVLSMGGVGLIAMRCAGFGRS